MIRKKRRKPQPKVTHDLRVLLFSIHDTYLGYIVYRMQGERCPESEHKALMEAVKELKALRLDPSAFLEVQVALPEFERPWPEDFDDDEISMFSLAGPDYPDASIGAVNPRIVGYLHVAYDAPPDEGEPADAEGEGLEDVDAGGDDSL